ncbi:MAG: hypothetical protein WAW10_11870 [Gallionella sp.]
MIAMHCYLLPEILKNSKNRTVRIMQRFGTQGNAILPQKPVASSVADFHPVCPFRQSAVAGLSLQDRRYEAPHGLEHRLTSFIKAQKSLLFFKEQAFEWLLPSQNFMP